MNARALVGYPPVLKGVLLRATVIWVGLRVALFLLAAASGAAGGSAAAEGQSGPTAIIALITVVGVLALIDTRITRELLFLRNLGLSRVWLFGGTVMVAGWLELMLRWILP